MPARSGRRSARPASASSAPATPSGVWVSAIARAAARLSRSPGATSRPHEVVEEGRQAAGAHLGGALVASGRRLGRVGLGPGVGQDQRRHPLGVPGHQRQRDIAAQRQPAHGRPPARGLGRDDRGDRVGEPVNRRAGDGLRPAETGEIGGDDRARRRQRRDDGGPEPRVERERDAAGRGAWAEASSLRGIRGRDRGPRHRQCGDATVSDCEHQHPRRPDRAGAPPAEQPGRPHPGVRRRPRGRHPDPGAVRGGPHRGRGAAPAGALRRPRPAGLGPGGGPRGARRHRPRVRGAQPGPAGRPRRPADRRLDRSRRRRPRPGVCS